MATAEVLRHRLADTTPDELAQLLTRRPDVLRGPAPRDLADLAERLWNAYSLVEALREVPASHLQVVEAACSLGDGCSRDALADLLAGDGAGHRADVDRVLDDLIGLAVLAEHPDGRVAVPASTAEFMPDPLGLGQPIAHLLSTMSVDAMRKLQTALGVAKEKNRAATVQSLVTFFAAPDHVFALLSAAPAEVVEYLNCQLSPATDDDDDDEDDDSEIDYAFGRRRIRSAFSYDPVRYRREQEAQRWAGERGLLINAGYGYGGEIPAEVARALRGRDYRAPFAPREPELAATAANPERVQQGGSAAASAFAAQLLTVLDHVARHPLAALKSGGVGARELAKLAKACSIDELVVRLTIECAGRAGLLDASGGRVGMSDAFAGWRESEPGEQFATVLRAWHAIGGNPTEPRDRDGKPRRALAREPDCLGCSGARVALLAALADLPADRSAPRRVLARRVMWRRPFAHVARADADDPFATPWREAELLGVIAHDALTSLGRALLAEPTAPLDPLVAACRDALPRTADHATFGSDLTAYAVGAPSAKVSALLDSAADRESGGGAVTWRFSPGTVRRALDEGTSGEALLAALGRISVGELPQPLRYLIADVARRHGNLRLTETMACVRSDDTALLAEVAADRKLAKLGLRLLAPTVLSAGVPLDALLAALRAAGYFPVIDESGSAGAEAAAGVGRSAVAGGGAAGRRVAPSAGEPAGADLRAVVRASRFAPPTAAGQARLRSVPDPAAVAAALLRAPQQRGSTEHTVGQLTLLGQSERTPTERTLLSIRTQLSEAEIRQLALAIDERARVLIVYRSESGGRTTRVIAEPELSGGTILAWCELRQDNRYFSVSRILSVVAV